MKQTPNNNNNNDRNSVSPNCIGTKKQNSNDKIYLPSEKSVVKEREIQQDYDQFKIMIDELQEAANQKISILEQFLQDINTKKTQIIQKFDSMINVSIEWKIQLIYLIEKINKTHFNQEFSISQVLDNIQKDIQNLTRFGLVKQIEFKWQSIIDIRDGENFVKNVEIATEIETMKKIIQQSPIYKNKINNKNNNIKILEIQNIQSKQIGEIQQRELCYCMAFNYKDNMLAAGFLNEIKIWKFDNGQLKETQIRLKGESNIDITTCLNFSKQSNILYCGSYNGSLSCWKEINNNRWEKICTQTYHEGIITSQILTRKEDQITTSSSDSSIIIWKVNQNQKISFDYKLQKHKKAVYSISINDSETQLVSSSLDEQLIIWGKNSQQIYQFNYVISKSISDFGHRVIFINDNTIVWQQSQVAISHVFQQVNNKFIEKPELQILLDGTQSEDTQFLFPPIYSKENQILILKFKNSIYIIKQLREQFQLQSKIECSTDAIYGCITKDGKYLIYWNYQFLSLNIYELNYK